MFFSALASRSWTAPHAQVHDLTCSGFGPSIAPQAEQSWDEGNQRSMRPKYRPYRRALYSTMAMNRLHPASCTDLASLVRARPVTHRSSTYTAWLSRMIFVE